MSFQVSSSIVGFNRVARREEGGGALSEEYIFQEEPLFQNREKKNDTPSPAITYGRFRRKKYWNKFVFNFAMNIHKV